MPFYERATIVVQCRFCGTKQETHNELVADHFIENGCPWCQGQFNSTAERLLQQVENLTPLLRQAKGTPSPGGEGGPR